MLEQKHLQKLLNSKFLSLRAANPAYSLRAFAKKLSMSPGAMSELLKGQRRASLTTAEKIADKLLLDPQERALLFDAFPAKLSRIRKHEDAKVLKYRQLTSDQFEVIAEWQHFAIISLMETIDFKPTPSWIAARLGLSQVASEQAFKRLIRLGLVAKNPGGKYVLTSVRYRTTDDIANISLRRAHVQNLQNAQASLENDDVKDRDFTFITMAIRPDRIAEAKQRIRKFQDELSELLEAAPQTEVYQMCVQLFPLSKVRKK